MPRPTKIPIQYAAYILNDSNRGYETRPDKVDANDLEEIAVNDGNLVPVSKMKRFFKTNQAFKEFKEYISVPDRIWDAAIRIHPPIRKYARRFMKNVPKSRGRPAKRQVKKYRSKLGTFSDEELSEIESDSSVISIAPSDYECDSTDVNIPLPSCAGLRRVCKKYDSSRRYLPYKRDSSENKQYLLAISYGDDKS